MPWSDVELVGITVSAFSRLSSLTLARVIKERHPHVHVALGGEAFLNIDFEDPEDLRDLSIVTSRYADLVVHGEGDTAIVRILEALDGKCEWDAVPNLIRTDAGELRINRPFWFERVPDLAPANYDGLPLEYYPGLSLEISRGCSWARCTFCVHARRPFYKTEFTGKSAYYRSLDAYEIVRRVQHLAERYDKNRFELSGLGISPQELTRICKALIETKTRIRWNARPRVSKTFLAGTLPPDGGSWGREHSHLPGDGQRAHGEATQ